MHARGFRVRKAELRWFPSRYVMVLALSKVRVAAAPLAGLEQAVREDQSKPINLAAFERRKPARRPLPVESRNVCVTAASSPHEHDIKLQEAPW
jgi:hypothetical protein